MNPEAAGEGNPEAEGVPEENQYWWYLIRVSQLAPACQNWKISRSRQVLVPRSSQCGIHGRI